MSDLDSALAAASHRFRERAGADRVQLHAAAASEDLAVLGQVAHRLAGTAGLYGYRAAGQAAEALEMIVLRTGSLTPEVLEALYRLCLELDEIGEKEV